MASETRFQPECDYDYCLPSQSDNTITTQDYGDEDLQESALLKSYIDRSWGLTGAVKFFRKTNYLSFTEDTAYESCCPFSRSQLSYLGSDELKEERLRIIPTKSCLKQYTLTDTSENVYSQFTISHLSSSNKKVITKSPHGHRIGTVLYIYGGYTSMDSFRVTDSNGKLIMFMKPEHISLQTFEFPVKDANNVCVANIFHKGSTTVLEMSPNLSPKLKLLLVPLVVLLMKIKAKIRRKNTF